ncbi:LysR family transcriptional regulator substrate-binding protein [Actinosynnema sp. NPDC059335]|uniref:LysR family transcriptional regulator substrate-binding protein n=1 Tax=Actinosynnema sp. NPDC059335 TaxID=3346804 RepID=UPI003672CF8A
MPDLRFGYHGSLGLPHAAVRAGGYALDRVELVEYDVRDPFAPLRAGRVDVMTSKFDHRQPDLVYSRPIGWDPRAVLVAPDHPLAARAEVSVEDVADHLAFHRPGHMPEEVWDRIVPPMTPGGKPIRRAFPLTTVPELMRVVASGAGVHLTVLSIRDVAPPTVRVLPVVDLPPGEVNLVHLPDAPPHVPRFVAAAEAVLARVEVAP